jgi:anthranilate synthase component 2
MVLMIDNYDSFTYNVVQYCEELGFEIRVVRNDEITVKEIKKLSPQKIIISPGPATPNEAGITLECIKTFKGIVPIFGICLGHQAIGQAFGAKVVRAKNLMHGKISTIKVVEKDTIFNNIPQSFKATRYHSLVLKKESIPENLKITAFSADDNEIMALQVQDYQIYGVQFHPESIMSEYGYEILNNFLTI